MEGRLESIDTLDTRQYQLAIKGLADSLSYGTDRSPFLGAGIEYVQSRPYQYGDAIRSIDWRVTARTGRLFVKEYEAPKRMPCWMLIDTSASMTVSSRKLSKYAIATHVAGGLAYACLDRVSPVGVLGVGESALRREPSLSRQQVLEWLHRLRRFRYDETTGLGERVSELAPRLKSRALVMVFSDLHDRQAMGPLKQLGQGHDVVVLHLQDPAEQGLRGSGIFRAQEAETGRTFVTHGRKQWIDPEAAATALRKAGIDYFALRTDLPFVHRLRYFLRARDLLGKGAR